MKPILFNTEMAKAILDGRKTVTRRVVKGYIPKDAIWGYSMFTDKGCISCRGTFQEGYGEKFFKLPYRPGDILYVRETWSTIREWVDLPDEGYLYKADWKDDADHPHWHPSIHMPKDAARIFLRVMDVSVERLQDITEEQARAEGVKNPYDHQTREWYKRCGVGTHFEVAAFAYLWDSTIKNADLDKYGWAANPWVWVIEFERIRKEDALKNAGNFVSGQAG